LYKDVIHEVRLVFDATEFRKAVNP